MINCSDFDKSGRYQFSRDGVVSIGGVQMPARIGPLDIREALLDLADQAVSQVEISGLEEGCATGVFRGAKYSVQAWKQASL